MEKELTSTEELDCESRFLTGRIKYDSKEEIYLLLFQFFSLGEDFSEQQPENWFSSSWGLKYFYHKSYLFFVIGTCALQKNS